MRFRDFLTGSFLETTPSSRLAGWVAVLLVLIWGTTWAAIRLSLEGFPPFLSMSLRFGMAGLLLALLTRRMKVPLVAPPMLCSAGLTALLSFWLERGRAVAPTPVAWLAVAYLGIVGSALTFTLFFWLLTRGNILRVSMIAYGTPVVAVFVGTFFLGEPLTLQLVGGAALVLCGVFAMVSR